MMKKVYNARDIMEAQEIISILQETGIVPLITEAAAMAVLICISLKEVK